MDDSFCSGLLREIENDSEESEEQESDVNTYLQYEIIEGLRRGSTLLWTTQEQQLYYRNSYSAKTQLTAYTCRFLGCTVRVFVGPDNTAYRQTFPIHTHRSQYMEYKQMCCEKEMKDRAKNAPSSMSPYDIFMEAVVE